MTNFAVKARKPKIRFARRRDRMLAFVWPPKRKQLRAQQIVLDFSQAKPTKRR